jgi:DNA-binding NtrC family response regulator
MTATRVLLVEDDRDVADLLVHVLHDAGYAVDLVSTVAGAMQRLAERRYGLVISDWRLADGDGVAVADRAADLGMKTAILSGYALAMPKEIATRHEIWMKPMRPRELVAAVERCIGDVPVKNECGNTGHSVKRN